MIVSGNQRPSIAAFFTFFLLYLLSRRLHIFFVLCLYSFFFFHLFLYCFFCLFFRSAHGTVFTATSTTSCWFHSIFSATCAVFTCASTAAPGMRAWQRDPASSNQTSHTQTGQQLLKILACHRTSSKKEMEERENIEKETIPASPFIEKVYFFTCFLSRKVSALFTHLIFKISGTKSRFSDHNQESLFGIVSGKYYNK